MENAVSHFKDRGTYILLAVESTFTPHPVRWCRGSLVPNLISFSVCGKEPGYDASVEDLDLVPSTLVLFPGSRVWAAAQELGMRLPQPITDRTSPYIESCPGNKLGDLSTTHP